MRIKDDKENRDSISYEKFFYFRWVWLCWDRR